MEESMFIKDIMRAMKKYLWVIIILAIIGGIAGKVLASNGQPPTYEATSLVLLAKQIDKTTLNINQPDDMNRFYATAQTLITTPVILSPVKKELGLKQSLDKLSGQVNVTIENTASQILNITVSEPSAKQATAIANATADSVKNNIKNYLSVKTAQVVQYAQPGSESKVLHSRAKANVVMGVIIGLVIGFVLAFILDNLKRKATV